MPELPEVETVRRGLEPVMAARRILRVEARRPDLRFPLPERFTARLAGAQIAALTRRGKHLLAALSTDETLVMHLGMSGRFTIDNPGAPAAPGSFVHARAVDARHDHVVFALEGGRVVTFNDPRRFGYMRLASTAALADFPPFRDMGPEPLSDDFSPAGLESALRGRSQAIKAALLDQRLVAGLGNIYVCEALFRARISPRRRAGAVTGARAERIVRAVKQVLAEAIDAGGSSLRDYAHADGSLGYFQHAFAVYGRAGEPCPRAGCPGVVSRLAQAGRSTFYCGRCQR